VWFVLGYALYATVFGALGALASRPEDAQSAAGPVSVVLTAGYFVSFAAIGSPDTAWAKAVSLFPATAPLAMPNRIAMGATRWWEPVAAAGVTVAAIVALVWFGGRVYSGGILHTGPTLKLRDAWQGATTSRHDAAATGEKTDLRVTAVLIGIAMCMAAGVFLLVEDAVIAVAVGAGCYALANRIVRARTRSHRSVPPAPMAAATRWPQRKDA
jgi:hypothetical protein